ncbi:MAG: hypothetical protein U5L45_15245 [Saprospiraceae bacterium]|nr:hypothetical protein [Saprospiraceae bacterium]
MSRLYDGTLFVRKPKILRGVTPRFDVPVNTFAVFGNLSISKAPNCSRALSRSD